MKPQRSAKAASHGSRAPRAAGPDPAGAFLSGPWIYALLAAVILVFFYPITFGKVFISPDSVAPAGIHQGRHTTR